MKNNKHHKLRDPLRRYVRTRVIRFRATHGVIHLSDFGREEMEDSDQALENRKHPGDWNSTNRTLNIREIIIDQLWCMNNWYICVIYDVCECMCIYYFQSRHTVYISYCNIWISQLWQLWTLIYNHPNPSIFFATKNKKHTEISSNNFQVDIFLSNQKTVSKHHLLHLGIPYSAKSASAAFGTCFLGLSESVQPEINRWEDVWLWIFRGFFVALLPCFFFRIVSRDFKIYSHIFLKDVFHQWRNSCMNHCVFFSEVVLSTMCWWQFQWTNLKGFDHFEAFLDQYQKIDA